MVRVIHFSTHWTLRCIMDSSDEDNTAPNVPEPSQFDGRKTGTQDTTAALWFSPDRVKKRSESSPPAPAKPAVFPSPLHLRAVSPTTSSPVLLETPPRAPPRPKTAKTRHSSRQDDRRAQREAAAPYVRACAAPKANHSSIEPRVAVCTVSYEASRPLTESAIMYSCLPGGCSGLSACTSTSTRSQRSFPRFLTLDCAVAKPVPHDDLPMLNCNLNCCPYGGKCDNGLDDSSKVLLGRNVRTRQLGGVAAEDISVGEVLGQYLGEIEYIAVSRAGRPRSGGCRPLLKQHPEKATYPIGAAINA
ncbi:hypothetical protein PF008_g11541 [Phytophthora fragariae]|uniref:SET domain-containing protein n=1 Tax=Phytophthora fragariae TaxID=53985 RepID=A0A6G0RR21_9STRA|nr:hypothetical protein PF008_g11541 [Phytophthora fragariae]